MWTVDSVKLKREMVVATLTKKKKKNKWKTHNQRKSLGIRHIFMNKYRPFGWTKLKLENGTNAAVTGRRCKTKILLITTIDSERGREREIESALYALNKAKVSRRNQ